MNDTNIVEDGLTKRLYLLLGDKRINHTNLFSNRAQISWQSLAMSPERQMAEGEIMKGMRRSFVEAVEKNIPMKHTDNPHGRDFSMYGFVFSEEQLLNLMHDVYQMGLDDGRPPVCPTIR